MPEKLGPGQSGKDSVRSGEGPDITDNRNANLAPKPGTTKSNTSEQGASRGQGGGTAQGAAGQTPPAGAGTGAVPGGKTGQGMGVEGAADKRNPDGSSQNRGPGTTKTVGKDTGQG